MTEIKRPGRRTLYEAEGATGSDVWEVPPSDPDEAADLIAEALAAEEHRQGAAYGDDPDHCGDCAAEALRRLQAACEHEDVHAVEVTMIDQPRRDLLATCGYCGLSWREEGEWL